MAFERRVELGDVRPELGQVVRGDEAVGGRHLSKFAQGDRLGGARGPARVPGTLGFEDVIAPVGSGVHTDLAAEDALLLAERDESATGEVEHRGRRGPAATSNRP